MKICLTTDPIFRDNDSFFSMLMGEWHEKIILNFFQIENRIYRIQKF